MQRFAFWIITLAATQLASVPPVAAQTQQGAAEPLLQKMAAAYSAAQSYSDTSVATFRNPDGTERSKVDFRIWFARPSHFRIDAQSSRPDGGASKREVMWSEGQNARTWSTDKPVTSHAKVQIAGSGMFGTYAYHVPTLLEASYGGRKRLHELGSPTLAGEEAIDGVDCHRIRGEFHGDPYEIWLGKADYLIRKIVASYRGNQMEEIHRNVSVNGPLSLEVFKFAPENEAVPPPAQKASDPPQKRGR